MKPKYIIILFTICLLLSGCQSISSDTKEEVISTQVTIKDDTAKIDEIQKAIENYLGEDIQKIGISYYDLSNNEGFNINGDTQFRSASIAKLFVVMYAYEQINKGNANNDTLLYYNYESDYEGGTGVLQYEDLSYPIRLERLLKVAIINSDNIAYYMLLRYFGTNEIMSYYENIVQHETFHDYIYMSANDSILLQKEVYANPIFETMREDMKNTEFEDRIALYLPSHMVAHKIGNFESYVHDVAIIESDHPYILTIFSNELDDAYEKIAKISEIIYNI